MDNKLTIEKARNILSEFEKHLVSWEASGRTAGTLFIPSKVEEILEAQKLILEHEKDIPEYKDHNCGCECHFDDRVSSQDFCCYVCKAKEEKKELKIIQITKGEKLLFGLGNDNKVYVWDWPRPEWILFSS